MSHDELLFHECIASERVLCLTLLSVAAVCSLGVYLLLSDAARRLKTQPDYDWFGQGFGSAWLALGALVSAGFSMHLYLNSVVAPHLTYQKSDFYNSLARTKHQTASPPENPPSAVEVKSTPAASPE